MNPFEPTQLPALAIVPDTPSGFVISVADRRGSVSIFRWQPGDDSRGVSPGSWSGPQTIFGANALGTPTLRALGDGAVEVWMRDEEHQLRHAVVGRGDAAVWEHPTGAAVYDPQVLSNGMVVTVGVQGKLWANIPWGDGYFPYSFPWGCGMPTLLPGENGFHAIGVAPDGGVRHYACDYSADLGHYVWTPQPDPPGPGPSTALVAADGGHRLDFFGAIGGNLVHWGWGPHGEWYRDDPAVDGRIWFDTALFDDRLSPVPGAYLLVGRDTTRQPVVFRWNDVPGEAPGIWAGSERDGTADDLPVAAFGADGRLAIAGFSAGVLTLWYEHFFDLGGWASTQWGSAGAQWDSGVSAQPAYIARRADDLVLLGVDRPSGTRVRLTLPPQHVAEQALPADQPLAPGGTVAGVAAGPSQIAFETPAGAATPTTVDELLGLLSEATVAADDTVLEIPRGVAFTVADAGVTMRHAALPETSADGVAAAWTGSLAWPEAASHGMRVRAVDGADDTFEVPTHRAVRSTLNQLGPADVKVDAVALSAAGASLQARAQTAGFRWEQRAIFGRDQRVTTEWHGVLMPFGHPARYTEDFARLTSDSEGEGDVRESIAAVRVRRVLSVLQNDIPVWPHGTFPFTRVELLDSEVRAPDPPDWKKVPRTADLDELERELAYTDALIQELELRNPHWFAPDFSVPIELEASADAEAYLRCIRERIFLVGAIDHQGYSQPIDVAFLPHVAGRPFPFRLRGWGPDGSIDFAMPLVFVADIAVAGIGGLLEPFSSMGNPEVLRMARELLSDGIVVIPPTPLHLDARRAATKPQEIHALRFGMEVAGEGFAPRLGSGTGDDPNWAAVIGVPAIRDLTGDSAGLRVEPPLPGDPADVIVRATKPLVVDFGRQADRIGALATPSFELAVISERFGPATDAAVAGRLNPAELLEGSAKLLGLDLVSLIRDAAPAGPPTISHALPITYSWGPVTLQGAGPLITGAASTLDIEVTATEDGPSVRSTLTDVGLALPPGASLFTVHFDRLTFKTENGSAPTLALEGVTAEFGESLALLSELASKVAEASLSPEISVDEHRARVDFNLPVPEVACGVFRMSNAAFGAGIEIPFSPPGLRIALRFASKESPFALGVMAFSGGGYVRAVLAMDDVATTGGIEEFEVALEFGASLAVNLGVARAEVHALGGVCVRYDGGWELVGYLRLGGSVELLGLVSVAVELRLELGYDSDTTSLWGRARLVVSVDITLTSFDLELDTGVWVFAGGAAPPAGHEVDAPSRDDFRRSRAGLALGELQ